MNLLDSCPCQNLVICSSHQLADRILRSSTEIGKRNSLANLPNIIKANRTTHRSLRCLADILRNAMAARRVELRRGWDQGTRQGRVWGDLGWKDWTVDGIVIARHVRSYLEYRVLDFVNWAVYCAGLSAEGRETSGRDDWGPNSLMIYIQVSMSYVGVRWALHSEGHCENCREEGRALRVQWRSTVIEFGCDFPRVRLTVIASELIFTRSYLEIVGSLIGDELTSWFYSEMTRLEYYWIDGMGEVRLTLRCVDHE